MRSSSKNSERGAGHGKTASDTTVHTVWIEVDWLLWRPVVMETDC